MSDHLSQSTCLEMSHPKTDEHVNPRVEVHHLVGKLSTAETLLTEVQRKVRNQGKTLYSPCKTETFLTGDFYTNVRISKKLPV